MRRAISRALQTFSRVANSVEYRLQSADSNFSFDFRVLAEVLTVCYVHVAATALEIRCEAVADALCRDLGEGFSAHRGGGGVGVETPWDFFDFKIGEDEKMSVEGVIKGTFDSYPRV